MTSRKIFRRKQYSLKGFPAFSDKTGKYIYKNGHPVKIGYPPFDFKEMFEGLVPYSDETKTWLLIQHFHQYILQYTTQLYPSIEHLRTLSSTQIAVLLSLAIKQRLVDCAAKAKRLDDYLSNSSEVWEEENFSVEVEAMAEKLSQQALLLFEHLDETTSKISRLRFENENISDRD